VRDRVLLLAGVAPGAGMVGEIILRDLILHYGLGSVNCVAIAGPRYAWRKDPRLDGLSVDLVTSPHVGAVRHGRSKWSALGAFARFQLGFRRAVARIVDRVVATQHDSDVIFAVLNNALTMAVSHRVARALQRPMVSLVWDHPDYLLQLSRFDRVSRAQLRREFDRSIAASRRVAVVSEAMRDAYEPLTRGAFQLLRHGIPVPAAAPAPLRRDEWVVGFAGSVYAESAFRAFLRALDQVAWNVAGRPVRVRLLTGRITLASRSAARIDYLGYRSSEETQRLLEDCDVTYLPQPFDAHLRDLCRYSFPTKLANYLAIGRPVFAHAPADSALIRYLAQNAFGTSCTSLEPDVIVRSLEGLLGDSDRYAVGCATALQTAREQFDHGVFERAVDQLLGTDDSPAVATVPSLGDVRS
jgi:hypothetical protein